MMASQLKHCALAVAVMAGWQVAALGDGSRPSQTTLEAMGLSGMYVMSDQDALAIRGFGFGSGSQASAWGSSFANVSVMGASAGSQNGYNASGEHHAEGANFSEASATITHSSSGNDDNRDGHKRPPKDNGNNDGNKPPRDGSNHNSGWGGNKMGGGKHGGNKGGGWGDTGGNKMSGGKHGGNKGGGWGDTGGNKMGGGKHGGNKGGGWGGMGGGNKGGGKMGGGHGGGGGSQSWSISVHAGGASFAKAH
jgi:hypothetical protein